MRCKQEQGEERVLVAEVWAWVRVRFPAFERKSQVRSFRPFQLARRSRLSDPLYWEENLSVARLANRHLWRHEAGLQCSGTDSILSRDYDQCGLHCVLTCQPDTDQ